MFWGSRLNPVNPQIEGYIEKLLNPLKHILSPDQLMEVRANTLFHIESRVQDFNNHADPVGTALGEYGDAESNGMLMLDEYCRGTKSVFFARTSLSATWWSFALFGIAQAITLLLVEISLLWPGRADLAPVAFGSMYLAPILAGGFAGRFVPTGNLRALGLALLALIPHAVISVFLISPYISSAHFIYRAPLLWIPIGAISLSLSAWLRRNRPYRHRNSQLLGET